MNEDQPFRLILTAGFLLVLPVTAYHRLRSQATGEKLDRRQEGLFLLVSIRLLGIAHMVGLIAFLMNPNAMRWAVVLLPTWIRWAGVVLGVFGGALLIWTLRHLGKNLTDTVVTRKEHRLVTTGPYRWVRHPFYVALALSTLANALAAANVFLFVTGAGTFLLLAARTRIEETKMLERFGNGYRAYMRQTGRYFPRPKAGA